MSAVPKGWPEGVPELPRTAVYALMSGPWQEPWQYMDRGEDERRTPRELADKWPMPSVVVVAGRVTYANAAALALGIVPDEEQEQQ